MRKSHFNEQFLVLLRPIISRFLHVQMRKKNKPKQQSMHALVLSLWFNPTARKYKTRVDVLFSTDLSLPNICRQSKGYKW